MPLIEEDTNVRFILTDSAIVFGTLFCDINTSEEGTLIDPQDLLYCFSFDPLTSKRTPGLSRITSDDVQSVSIVGGLPVKTDFTIDSVESFTRMPMAYHAYMSSGFHEALHHTHQRHAASFIESVSSFLHEHALLIRPLRRGEICRNDLSDLGLDFMRQYYRQAKNAYMSDHMLPGTEALSFLLKMTEQNRTTDPDWSYSGKVG